MKQSKVALSPEYLQNADSFRSGKGKVVFSLLLFAVIPSIFMFVALQLTQVRGPQWLGSYVETSYDYLFNSLLIVKGEPPFDINHPGTTTQVFGAAVLEASGHGSGDQLIKIVLNDPEKFLRRVHRALLIVCALTIWIFPWLTALSIGSYAKGVLLQFPILFFNTIFWYSVVLGSELTLVAFSIAAVSLCVVLLSQRDGGTQKQPTLVLAGVICGLGIATKLTFFPLILITFLCCRRLRSFLVFGASFLVAAALALLPIYSELPRVFHWILRLSIHSGRYGSGGVGFATANYVADATNMLSAEASVWLVPVLATGTIVWLTLRTGWKSLHSSARRLVSIACIVFIVQTATFVIVARQSAPRYLVPLYVSTGLNLVFLWQLVLCLRYQRKVRAIAAIVLLCLLLFGVSSLIFRAPALYQSLQATRLAEFGIYSRVKKKTENAVRVDYYRSVSPEFAMWSGNYLSRRTFAGILEKQFPKSFFYNALNGNFETFGDSIKPEAMLKKYDHLFFFGNRVIPGWVDYGHLDCFNAKNLKLIDRQGQYVLEEWTRE
jgi:hypothetical protein